ncbi:hypothetical protein B5G26_04450 [Anaerotignum lactatifermentans]|uniref:Uncharacterized protein n=1 Tax=Anaerotignum lactatifermentans TaxID=160404 RepID=A0A1Y3U9W2_9FIRM|nr:hypothetical protein B5G26_04450 [Anaerotignum lactatifermentans]
MVFYTVLGKREFSTNRHWAERKKIAKKITAFAFFTKKALCLRRQKAFGNCNQDFCFREM